MTQHDSWACSRVGWTIPATHAKANSLRIEHPIRTLAYRNLSLVGRIGIFVSHTITVSFNNDPLPVMHQPVDQGRGQGVVHVKDFAPVPEGSIRGDHDRSNFITGGDNLEQQIGPMLVDGQIAQLIEERELRYSPGTINTRIRRRLPVYCDLGVSARDFRASSE